MNRTFPYHVLLFSLYPVLFVCVHNIGEAIPLDAVSSAGIIAGSACFLSVVLAWMLRGLRKAAALVTFFLIFFFSFGQVYQTVGGLRLGDVVVGRPLVIAFVWGILFGVIACWMIRTRSDLKEATRGLNLAGLFLIGMNLFHAGTVAGGPNPVPLPETEVGGRPVSLKGPAVLPDVYYIILDSYARGDVLKEIFGYDNQEFMDFLKSRGFYVAPKSRCNYCSTHSSLASSLNLSYLGGLEGASLEEHGGTRPYATLIGDSRLARTFRKLGYQFISFATGYAATEIRNADLYLTSGLGLSEFQHLLLNMTPLPWVLSVMDRLHLDPTGVEFNPYAAHRRQTLYTLKHLPLIAARKEPTFTLAHILVPRAPFLWGSHGEEREPEALFSLLKAGFEITEPEALREAYRDQLIFISRKIEEVIDRLLAQSPTQPIIILQGDHGPGGPLLEGLTPEEQFRQGTGILNAYLVPEKIAEQLYPEISPVNSFRVVLNYFGAGFDLLEDKTLWSGFTPEA